MTFVCRTITFFLLLFSLAATAQNISAPEGTFEVDNVEGCEDLPIKIKYNKPCVDCLYTLLRGSTKISEAQNTNQLTITEPGTYRLEILFQGQQQGSIADFVQIVVTPDTPPAFELYTCGNNRVAFNVTDTNFDNYSIDFGDGSPPTMLDRGISLSGSHTYASAGTQNISVKGINDNALPNCTAANQSFTAMNVLPVPTINLLQVLDESSIRITFNGQTNMVYRLEVAPNNAPSFQVVRTLYNVTSDTVRNLKTDDNFYCYRLGVVNPCTGAIQYSPVICSANADLEVKNNQNTLTWQTRTAGVSNYRITRSTSGSSILTTVSSSPFTDTDIACGRDYCYRLTTLYPNSAQSISLTKCGTAISNDIPDATRNISSVVKDAAVDLSWNADPNFPAEEYTVYKNINDVSASMLKTALTKLTDQPYSTEVKTCYKVQYTDVCGNQSLISAEACPIRLTASLQTTNAISLTWSDYTGWANGVSSYSVQKYTPEGALLQTFTTTSTSFVDDTEDLLHQALVYVVTAIPVQAGITPSVSNRVVIVKSPNIFYARAFTPNDDNLNDIFNVSGQFIEYFELSIFNRWGELMYTTTAISEGWDGTFKGNKMPEATYTFIVRIVDRAGRNIKESGSVVLLRKN